MAWMKGIGGHPRGWPPIHYMIDFEIEALTVADGTG